jgi:sec-independent protein translocase protein TatB
MFDIGIGEIIVIAVIGLLVFGPERLPRAAADAAKWLRQIRAMASGARSELAESAGIDLADTVDTVKSLQEFHPRRLAADLLKDTPDAPAPGATAPGKAAGQAPPPPPAAGRPAYDPDAT